MIHIPHRVPHTTEYLGDNYNWGNRHYRHKYTQAVNGDRYKSQWMCPITWKCFVSDLP